MGLVTCFVSNPIFFLKLSNVNSFTGFILPSPGVSKNLPNLAKA
jgi:hypothetical protein